MSIGYYYTLTSLPLLLFDSPPQITCEQFIENCERLLNENESVRIKQMALFALPLPDDNADMPPIYRDWCVFENSLRLQLLPARETRSGIGKEPYQRPVEFSADSAEAAREALACESPLQSEEALNSARWRKIDELAAGNQFDFTALVAYYLRLQLLERKFGFDRERGSRMFDMIHQGVKEKIERSYNFN